ncbi:SIR2 family protein [Neotabrizicola shimadae]|uniref:SIR2 family protein n=1 Tax=Neotabrizicola shimadae TaxID=2807096 RepID=A0A8G1EBW1_9RHOB|nr:SIR2 family protein [Neotabrizicola shimadae]
MRDAANRFGRNPATEHIFRAIDEGDLLHACEWLKNRFDENWTTHLRSLFVDPHYTPGRLHELLALLDTRVVFSLNFDDIYETKSREINEASQFTKNYYDTDVCEFLRGSARYVVKVHGSLASPASLIFTQEDYSKARSRNSLFYSAFDAALMTHTFLFVGCGYGDPDINLLLENQAFSVIPGTVNPHYFLTSAGLPEDLRNSLRRNRNLKTLIYDRVDDNHSGLVAAIEDLLTRVNDERALLIENGNW